MKLLPVILSDGTAGGQLGAVSSQFIRGANSAQVLILLDGRSISDIGFFGGFDLSELTTDAIERIEVVPGGGSTLYGSDAIGGVINIITRVPTSKPEVCLSSSVGSFGLNQQGIQARGRSGNLGWVVGYNRTESNNDFPYLSKLSLYQELREIYVLGTRPIPFAENPLKRPYLCVYTSSRCYPSRRWQLIVEALQSAVEQAGLNIEVRTSGSLEVCKLSPVVFYSAIALGTLALLQM